ncbi:MAG: MerR family transcriptional regulator [Eubacteriales bacterium]|nr:MerR family transcriptional regulator [Eubacteriales bacterium]
MFYTVGQLAKLSGVSTRTLRLYDQMGLLRSRRDPENGYRRYGPAETDTLQQILFFREMGMGLEEIKSIVLSPEFDQRSALTEHYHRLIEQRERTEALLRNVQNTLNALNGGKTMKDVEKFEGLKRRAIQENEQKYGEETRAAYGDAVVEASKQRVSGMSQEKMSEWNGLETEIIHCLKAAMAEGDPAGEKARELCQKHKEWLCMSWPEGMYTKELHRSLGESYAVDERFAKYYDGAAGQGAAAFLSEAIDAFTVED